MAGLLRRWFPICTQRLCLRAASIGGSAQQRVDAGIIEDFSEVSDSLNGLLQLHGHRFLKRLHAIAVDIAHIPQFHTGQAAEDGRQSGTTAGPHHTDHNRTLING
jgi:hypothetical protein